MKKIIVYVLPLVLCWVFNVYAADQSDGSDIPPPPGMCDCKKPMRSIPREAVDACKGKAEGATCDAGPDGTGKCFYTPDQKYFACKPERGGRKRDCPPPRDQ